MLVRVQVPPSAPSELINELIGIIRKGGEMPLFLLFDLGSLLFDLVRLYLIGCVSVQLRENKAIGC